MRPKNEVPSCSWCGLKVRETYPARCRRCNLILCSPYLRDCWDDHWRWRHVKHHRRVTDVRTERV